MRSGSEKCTYEHFALAAIRAVTLHHIFSIIFSDGNGASERKIDVRDKVSHGYLIQFNFHRYGHKTCFFFNVL